MSTDSHPVIMTARTCLSMATLYGVAANTITTYHDAGFDHRMGVVGVVGFIIAEGAYHIIELRKHIGIRHEERTWTNPDCVLHFHKGVAGTLFFGMLFGSARTNQALQFLCRLISKA
ncbi:hypothetical protein M438DRAFT_153443 [Aureobasidium pullulans EXF-150]|uniref:Uncharacterized protein n=1 Tax=Aureobasidium pullulans EXF-150 TaxID=1043002 RepID=A0A074X180_AURPU|nr:uncharacterized protein M438DRAFT_153443 [Aureobasidium pullulans EXF-150]KEQ79133.1 hypothetical protein M438DRAFT_153443 [Aureobasidium pullulans EXF-150]